MDNIRSFSKLTFNTLTSNDGLNNETDDAFTTRDKYYAKWVWVSVTLDNFISSPSSFFCFLMSRLINPWIPRMSRINHTVPHPMAQIP